MKPYRLCLLLATTLFIQCTPEQDLPTSDGTSPVVARVNQATLTLDEAQKRQLSYNNTFMSLQYIVSQWINEELLYQAALNQDLDRDRVLRQSVERYRRGLLGQTFLDISTRVSTPVTREEIRGYYEQHRDSFIRQAEEARIYHFVVNDRNEARSIQRTLRTKKSGGERKDLFARYRVDAVTVRKGFLRPELDDAIFKSSGRSSVLGPLETDAGHHVIEVLDRFPKGSQIGLNDAYDEIYQRLLTEKTALQSLHVLDSLRANAHIEVQLEPSLPDTIKSEVSVQP